MAHPNILDPFHSALVVVDIQEAFRNAMPDFGQIASNAATIVRGFDAFGLPVMVTEQYPRGLGPTAEEIALSLPTNAETFEKTAFSSCGAVDFAERLTERGVRQVVVCGIEAHVCVNQTVHDLLDRGFEVHLLLDCVSSRTTANKLAGIAKMQLSGAVPSSIEMALFELLRDANHERFKEIQALIK